MQQATFDLQTITPLFLAGADQTTAELRSPSLRGGMRYWQRALVGGLVGANANGLAEVVKAETAVFGSTTQGSPVSIRISGEPGNPELSGRWGMGTKYLFWSMVMARENNLNRSARKTERPYFSPDTHFQVTLAARDGNEVFFQRGISAFWLLTHLGGIGSRSRRCAGSVQATGDTTLFPFTIAETPEALRGQLTTGIRLSRDLYMYQPSASRAANFDALSPETCSIKIFWDQAYPWTSWDQAVDHIGTSLQSYRRDIGDIQRRKVFGLPLKGDSRRYSSPLLLRITKLQRNQFVAIAVLFKTTTPFWDTSNYGLIEDWIRKNFSKVLEVKI